MAESAPGDIAINSTELELVSQTTHEIATPLRPPEENLELVKTTAVDLYRRAAALPSDLLEIAHSKLRFQDYGGRGVFIGLRREVIEIGEGGVTKKAEHWYDMQVHSEANDRSKPFDPGEDPYSVSLSAETNTKALGLQFRCAGSMSSPDSPRLRAMSGMNELKPADVQAGIDAILAELSTAVNEREELARTSAPTEVAQPV
jgi:hypothetical protein